MVTIEPVSNFIVLEHYAADRTAATWTAALREGCTGLAVEVIQSTADEAKALRRHAESDLGAHPVVSHPDPQTTGRFRRKYSTGDVVFR